MVEKSGASQEILTKFLPREMDTIKRLHHKNILRVYRLVETPRQVYFMLEMAHNGDLLDYINRWKVILEPEARFVMRSMRFGKRIINFECVPYISLASGGRGGVGGGGGGIAPRIKLKL